jgi:hypothetical protein
MTDLMRVGTKNLLAAAAIVVAACSGETPKRVATTDTAIAKPAPANVSFVGLHYDPLPPGASYEGGSVLLGKNGKPSAFALSHVLAPAGNYVWLDSVLPNDGAMRSRIVRAELQIPRVAGDERLFIGSCDVGGKLDGGVLAVAVFERNVTQYKQIRRAWRADPGSGAFVVIPTDKIVCEDPGR